MNRKRTIKQLLFAVGLTTLFASCDKDYTELGSDIIGGGDYTTVPYVVKDIKAYNQAYGAAESTKLPEVSLGSMDLGVFGRVDNSLVLNFAEKVSETIDINTTAVLDSVYLYIPFYNVEVDKKEEDQTIFKLPSVYGTGSFNLNVYQNGYLLSHGDPISGGLKKYYSNDFSKFENNKSKLLNAEGTLTYFRNTGYTIYKKDEAGQIEKDESGKEIVEKTLPPGFWINLDKKHFQDLIVTNKLDLNNTASFNESFRGLFLETSAGSNAGAIGLIDPSKGYLRIGYYQEVTVKDEEGKDKKETKRGGITFPLTSGQSNSNLTQVSNILVSLLKSSNDETYQNIVNTKEDNADELYIRGGQGSVAVIELFKDNDFEELKKLREEDVLLNDAFLTVTLNKDAMGGSIPLPERLFLYNYDASSFVQDFVQDAEITKPIFGGALVKPKEGEDNPNQYTYTFRIKDHIQALLKSKDLRSPKLAIAVSNPYTATVRQINFKSLLTPIENTPVEVSRIPSTSLTSPLGAILHGATPNNGTKQMKLELYYTRTK